MTKPGWFEGLTIGAIVLGPVLALLAQRVLDRLRERKKQRVGLYFALMSTRAQQLAPVHVQALNSIDIVFNRRWKDKKIREAWRAWRAHADKDSKAAGWTERSSDLKVELYQAIGKAVGYTFDIDYLKRQAYLPVAHVDIEAELVQIRQTLAKILTTDGLRVIVGEQKREPPQREAVR